MEKRIAVVTATRAEYWLLLPVIQKLREYENAQLKVELIATGTHLSEEYGMTINEIRERIDYRILVSVRSDTDMDISQNQAEALVKFTEIFRKRNYSAVMLLGDRYEILAVAVAAGNTGTPVFHLCGGDTTEGAVDEWIRHSVTKISYLHFVTNAESRKRVIQLGEDPSRVFNYGSTSIDNILTIANIGKEEALQSIGLKNSKYALCTYHPVTMERGSAVRQAEQLLNAIRAFPEIEFIVTKANADQSGAEINRLLDRAEKEIENLHVFVSLGSRLYLSLMRFSEFVIGNSSSGIIEAPALHVATVNIGNRQRGRLQSGSIINCRTNTNSIIEAIRTALSDEHKKTCREVVSPYGTGHAAEQIAAKVIETVNNGRIDLRKKFYDL